MAMMLGALYDALVSRDGDPDKARKAAEEVAAYDARLAAIEARLTLQTWMIATLVTLQIAFGVGNIWLTLNVLARLGAR